MIYEELDEIVDKLHKQDLSRPITVGVMGDFSGHPEEPLPSVIDRKFVDVTLENLDPFLAWVKPRLSFRVKNRLESEYESEVAIELNFTQMRSFHPLEVLRQTYWHKPMLNGRRESIDNFSIVEEIDKLIDVQLNEIIHHPEFQALESSWRGLHHLLIRLPSSSRLRIRVLNITKNELGKIIKNFKGTAWDQSPIFKKIYEEEVGTFGGCPFSLLIGDYAFGHNAPDVDLLYGISKIAAASGTVFMAAASPALFGETSFAATSQLSQPARLFNAREYVGWHSLKDSVDSRFLALAMPRVLMRTPFHAALDENSGYVFHEIADSPEQRLWGNPAYFIGAELLGGFAQHYCYASNSAKPYSGIISNLPSVSLRHADQVAKTSLEQEFSHDVVGELESMGFIILHCLANSERLVYTPPCAIAATKTLNKDSQDIDLPYLPPLMLGVRIFTSLRSLVRDLRGTALEPELIHAMETWIHTETCPSLNPDLGQKIQFPLHTATVSVMCVDAWRSSLKIGLTLTTHPIPSGHGKKITMELTGTALIDTLASWASNVPFWWRD
jgi:type VI secretion system protein ImpC